MTSASSATNQTIIGKMRSHETTSSTSRSSPQNNVGIDQQQSPNWSKIQVLKQRKSDLEKLLNEKNLLLQQIQRQEQQIIAGDFNNHINNNATLRRKIGTSFKMPNKNGYTNKELGGSVGDVEKKVRQEIFNAPYKLSNDQNSSKPIRHLHKSEYDAAQQKLIAINHGVNMLKKQQHQRPPIPTHAEPSTIITLNLTKAPSVAGEHNTTMKQCHSTTPTALLESNLSNNNKYGSNNSVNNYYTSERRNSIKSMQQQNSPKQQYDDRSPTMLLKTQHRSDYDLANKLLIVTPQSTGVGNGNSGYLYDNAETVLLNNNIIDSGYYNNNNMKFKTSPISNNNSNDGCNRISTVMTTNMVEALNYYPTQQLHQQQPAPQQHQLQHHQYDDAAALFLAQRAYCSGGRKYQYGDSIDSISISPSTGVMSTIDHQQTGLGGYWRTLGNERIWYTVDTSYDCSSIQQAEKLKKANTIATTPTKSLSLGNFDIISGKDELGDKISISSMNSENNKKQKEKYWLETSLDGPLIKTKHQSSASSLSPTHHHSQPHPIQHHHHYNTSAVQHQHPHNHHSPIYHRDRTKLSSQSISSTAYHIPKLEDQQYLSYSTSMLHNSSSSGPILEATTSSQPMNYHHHHYHQSIKQQQSPTPPIITIQQHTSSSSSQTLPNVSSITYSSSPPPIPPQSSSMLLKQQSHHHHQQQQYQPAAINPRSPIIANLTHHDSIRIESPKNMTVIQQAVFMPYKEITKPFEMSDFYKYSTKFRQKEKQQQVEVEQ